MPSCRGGDLGGRSRCGGNGRCAEYCSHIRTGNADGTGRTGGCWLRCRREPTCRARCRPAQAGLPERRRTMRAGIYVRVSTQRQAQADGIAQQLERLQARARQEGWTVAADDLFRDDGFSGATLRRPGLERLRDRAASHALEAVLITAPDRLARNYVHQVLLLEELAAVGCRVEFLDRPMSE